MSRRAFTVIGIFVAILLGMAWVSEQGGQLLLHGLTLPAEVRHLPLYTAWSFSRMLVAYCLALLFSLVVGYWTATSIRFRAPLLATLDILQSIPILGFFPIAIIFFVGLTEGQRLGIELASIFLIFTSQAWNLTFGVYESLVTIPEDLRVVTDGYRVHGWTRLVRTTLPACVPRLVSNSILSWASGWYFLIACELITMGPLNYQLPGLGSFLMKAIEEGRLDLLLLGLGVLGLIITLMDLWCWRPLSVWATRFTDAPADPVPVRGASLRFMRGRARRLRNMLRHHLERLGDLFGVLYHAVQRIHHVWWRGSQVAKHLLWMAIGACLLYGLGRSSMALVTVLRSPWPPEVSTIPAALAASFWRLTVAYGVALLWTIPLALWISERPRSNWITLPLQIVASMPATALFPLLIFLVHQLGGGSEVASIVLLIFVMQWYLLFNLIGGARVVPHHLKETAQSFGLPRWLTWRRLLLPAMMPAFVTGSLTAWGGGWNALIISEYFVYQRETHTVRGIGALLSHATYGSGNTVLMVTTLASMTVVVVLMNRTLWARLYRVTAERYRLEA